MEPFGAVGTGVVDANSLKDMVGPWGLEPQASTVSRDIKYLQGCWGLPST